MNPAVWLAGLFAGIDAMDTERFVGHLAEDAEFRFGNLPPAHGRTEIAALVGGFFGSIGGLSHTVHEHWASGDTLICRGTVTYRRHDAAEVTVPFANIMKLADGRAVDYRIYADVSPVFAATA